MVQAALDRPPRPGNRSPNLLPTPKIPEVRDAHDRGKPRSALFLHLHVMRGRVFVPRIDKVLWHGMRHTDSVGIVGVLEQRLTPPAEISDWK
jgi:hypothetical protein